jgi:hypothetical protein
MHKLTIFSSGQKPKQELQPGLLCAASLYLAKLPRLILRNLEPQLGAFQAVGACDGQRYESPICIDAPMAPQ